MSGWVLPDSPDSRAYQAVIADISVTLDAKVSRAKFRALCEADFWAFCKWASTYGKFQIKDPGHKNLGGFWVDEPYVFDFARRIQEDLDSWRGTATYFEPRFHFKTELVTKLSSIWLTLKDPLMTTAVLMYKVDQVGEALFKGLLEELEKNQILLMHWPDVLSADKRDYPLWTNTAATIKRPAGPKEPSFSIHSLSQQPTSGHYRRIVVDDAVVQQVVDSKRQIQETKNDLKRAVALGADDTRWAHVGTIWDSSDPNMQLQKEGFFGDAWCPISCYHEDGVTPRLRSKGFLANWIRQMGPYIASCQLLLRPIAKDNQGFRLEWIENRYRRPPREIWTETVVHIFYDFSSGFADDFMSLAVIGLGRDRLRYHLDLVREKAAPSVALDLIFACVEHWSAPGRPVHTFWTEDPMEAERLRSEMERRTYRFRVRVLPADATRTPKERRISNLQPALARGEHVFPLNGFGHGSHGDTRDTMEQFLEDEYKFWTPLKGGPLNDDMLDSMAWPEQESVRRILTYPQDRTEDATTTDLLQAAFEEQRAKTLRAGMQPGPSWNAW
jgi:hypothetical protein